MTNFTLTLDALPGASIEDCAADACAVANRLGINIEFMFNGVKCLAAPGGDPRYLAVNQQYQQRRKLEGPFDTRYASTSIPRPDNTP